jgi:hypothetical protein
VGEITSVRRTPNLSLITTASPRAITLSLTTTSRDSPASLLSSTIELTSHSNRSRISIRVVPRTTATSSLTSYKKSILCLPMLASF